MSNNAMDNLNSLIPEFYYDLICRIVPGVILCFIFGWSVQDNLVPLGELSGAILAPLAFVLSYATGFVLDIFSGSILRFPNWMFFKGLSRITRRDKRMVWETNVWQVILSVEDDAHRSKLKKMMAERAVLRNLLVLSVVVWLSGSWPMSCMKWEHNTVIVLVLCGVYYQMEFWVKRDALDIKSVSKGLELD